MESSSDRRIKTERKEPQDNRPEWVVISCLFVPFLLLNLAGSAQGPLFPEEAAGKGIGPSVYALVPAINRAMLIILSPVTGLCVYKLGTRYLFILGIFLNAIGPTLFGLLHFVSSPQYFIFYALVLRSIEGIGNCFIQIPGFMIVNKSFEGRTSIVASIVLTALMLGFCFGPILAAILYDIGGFPVPFIVFGLLQFIAGVTVLNIFPKIHEDHEDLPKTTKEALTRFNGFFQFPFVYVFIFGVVCANMGNAFLESILEPGLERFDLAPLQVGLTFGLYGFFQLLIPIWGLILDRINRGEYMTLCGSIFCIVGIGMVGPYPFIPCSPLYSLTAIGLALFGLGKGLTATSAYSMLKQEVEANVGDIMLGNSFVATCQVGATGVGGFIGAAGAGILLGAYGFREATYLMFGPFLILLILLLIFIIQQTSFVPNWFIFGRFVKNKDQHGTGKKNETTPLLNPELLSLTQSLPHNFKQDRKRSSFSKSTILKRTNSLSSIHFY